MTTDRPAGCPESSRDGSDAGDGRSRDEAAPKEVAPDSARGPGPTDGENAPGTAVTSPEGAPDGAASAQPGGRRRRGHRRATGGTAPDAECALRTSEWGAGSDELGGDDPDPREAAAESGHAQWLKQQRPPHWG